MPRWTGGHTHKEVKEGSQTGKAQRIKDTDRTSHNEGVHIVKTAEKGETAFSPAVNENLLLE